MFQGNVMREGTFKKKSTGIKKIYTFSCEGCSDDFSAVAAMPSQWQPRRSGSILANYLNNSQRKHEQITKEMIEEAAKVNKNIDTKVRALAELLLNYIEKNKRDSNCIIEACETNSTFNTDVRDETVKKLRELYSQLIEEVAQFKRESLCLERERADEIREVLRKQFQRLIEIGYKPQKDLLHEFDERIYGVNQQLLSNSRAYADLEAQLHCQADESLIKARSKLNQLALGATSVKRLSSAQPWPSIKEKRDRPSSENCLNESTVEVLLSDMQEYFDKCVARSVEAYRLAVVNVYTGFFDKFKNLQMSLNCLGLKTHATEEAPASDIEELQAMVEKAIENLSNSVLSKVNCTREMLESARSDAGIMQESLKSLGEQLRSTYSILHDAGHLWDPHLLRLALAQKLTITAVEDMVTNHDIIELTNEVPFNIALEQLRTCADIEKLPHYEEILQNMLNRTADLYYQHSQEEIARLNEFMSLPPLMANLLLAEFNLFLEKYPRKRHDSAHKVMQTESPNSRRKPSRSIVPKTILQTSLQEVALENWQRGFLESIQSNIASVPGELERHALLWVEERTISLTVRYSMKMASHSIRSERVKAAHNARLAELHHHEDRLQSHLSAINIFVEKAISQAAEFLSLESPQLYPIKQWVASIEEKAIRLNDEMKSGDSTDQDVEVKKLKMASYKARLIRHKKLFEESLEEFIENHKKQVQQCFQAARISNVRFISDIKLFSQGGRFAAQEALRFSAAIVKASDFLEQGLINFMDTIAHRYSNLLVKADQLVDPVRRLVDEEKAPKRGMMDKMRAKAKK